MDLISEGTYHGELILFLEIGKGTEVAYIKKLDGRAWPVFELKAPIM